MISEEERNTVINIIENGYENDFIDYKSIPYDFSKESGKKEFVLDILSFANSNTQMDRYIIIGVNFSSEGKRKYIDIYEKKELIKDSATYQQIIYSSIEPKIEFDYFEIEHNSINFGIYRINKDNIKRPYIIKTTKYGLTKGTILIRSGSQKNIATRFDLDIMYKKQKETNHSDFKLLSCDNNKCYDELKIFSFKKNINPIVSEQYIEIFNKIKNIQLREEDIINTTNFSINRREKCIINDEQKNSIIGFAEENNLSIPDNFFDIGNCYEEYNLNGLITNSYALKGGINAIEKYKLIEELSQNVSIYKEYKHYCNKFNEVHYISLAVQNIGLHYDEEVQINVDINKNDYYSIKKLPIPDKNLIKAINEYGLEKFMDIYINNPNISSYRPNSIINTNFNANRFSTPFRDYNTTYDYDVEKYYEQIEDIFDFEETEYDNFYRFSFVQKSINPSEIVLFPAIIFVKKDIQSIKFSITGRYTKKIITGFLSIK